MQGITIFAPGVCAPWTTQEGYGLPAPQVPMLQRLLARGDQHPQSPLAFEDALARVLGYASADVPWGALGLWGETGERPEGFVLRLDPVHLRLGMTEAIVTAGAALPLSPVEAQELARALETHFVDRGWTIVVAAPQRWYLCVPESGELVSVPLGQALGRDAGVFKPQGKDARRWLADLNEAQMVLFAHPLNAAREARGLPVINSLWPWGAGELLPTPSAVGRGLLPAQFAVVYADHPLARGLALAAGIPVHFLPETLAELEPLNGQVLIVLDDALQARLDGDYEDWQASIEGMEARWFAPLWKALAQKQVSSLMLETGGAACFVCKPAHRWRFWRTVKPLESLCSAASV